MGSSTDRGADGDDDAPCQEEKGVPAVADGFPIRANCADHWVEMVHCFSPALPEE